jgi:signal transduction histidine kinase
VPNPGDPRERRAAVRQALAATLAAGARARLAAETARAYARLQELDALRMRFVALAAHELRTPLHVLGAALEVLGGCSLDVEASAVLATARRNVAWLGRSVGAMTDLVRLARPTHRTHGPLCLAEVVRRVVADVAPFCRTRGLALVVDAPDVLAGTGDADDLHRALVNVCLNAIRFTRDGGRVTVALRGTDDADELAVADTGVGMSAELAKRVGEPFVTGAPIDAHHSDPIAFGSGGLGLGLAVARAIVADHGGELRIESVEGRGTTVRLVLPRGGSIDSSGDRRDNAPP